MSTPELGIAMLLFNTHIKVFLKSIREREYINFSGLFDRPIYLAFYLYYSLCEVWTAR
jgi:hypothetical protein